MKAKGVLVKVDDFGLIALPKNVRQNLGIEKGDTFELFTEAGKSCSYSLFCGKDSCYGAKKNFSHARTRRAGQCEIPRGS